MLTGKCECGAVKFKVYGPIKDLSHCHCSMCRRLHGAAFATWAAVSKDAFQYTAGEDAVRHYVSSAIMDRYFCGNCGASFLCSFKEEPHLLYLAMGNVDGDPERPDGYHFFVDSKAPWIEIGDGLPQYPEWPPEEKTKQQTLS